MMGAVMGMLLLGTAIAAADEPLPEVTGITLSEVMITSSMDGTEQPVIVGVPDSYQPGTPTPLLVGLHTWSADYKQRAKPYGMQAATRGWLMVLPNFRGPNKSGPTAAQAGGSLLAQRDIVDARAFMIENYSVDPGGIYLTGDSGGGHMTLLMAGKHPDLWTAVAAWCPVTDFRDWWALDTGYSRNIEAVTGGSFGDSPEVDFEYTRRSPRTFMTNLAHLPVLFGHGDGDPVIPVDQSWATYRELKRVPAHRTVFYSWGAGHTGLQGFGLDWCVEQTRSLPPLPELHLVTDESKSYAWADLQMADETRLATADIVRGEDALSVATSNLSGLALQMNALPLPEGGTTVAVRNDLPLTLTLEGIPAGATMTCEGGWATVQQQSDEALVLSVQPSEEARSLRLAW